MPAAVAVQPIAPSSSTPRQRTASTQHIEAVSGDEFAIELRYGISVHKLRRMRTERTGPKYVCLPRLVRYFFKDVDEWLETHKIEPEEKPFNIGRGRPRKDGTPANAATGSARSVAEMKARKG